jgi:hypothetical protein
MGFLDLLEREGDNNRDSPTLSFNGDSLTFKLPMAGERAEQFLMGYFGANFMKTVEHKNGSNLHVSPQSLRGIKSAIVWLHSERGCILDSRLNNLIDEKLVAYQREYAAKREAGSANVKLEEGKHPFTFPQYEILCTEFFKSTPEKPFTPVVARPDGDVTGDSKERWDGLTFGWSYLTLQWNLMARASNVAHICLANINWVGDCMTVTIQKQKGDPIGMRVYPKHVYCNPFNPSVCPLLALAVYLLCLPPGIHNPNHMLFPGNDSKSRYGKLLRRTAGRCLNCILLEALDSIFGTHSARKGPCTYCAMVLEAPSPITIHMRMGWAVGNVACKYIFDVGGGDQQLGRIVCGLPVTDERFAALPPRFSQAGVEYCNRNLDSLFPGASNFPASFRAVVPYLIAVVVYQEEFINSSLPISHPLFKTNLFSRNHVKDLQKHMLNPMLGLGHCPITNMQASGVPTNLVIVAEVSRLKREHEQMQKGLQVMQKGLEKSLEDQFAVLPKAVGNYVLQECDVNGAKEITRSQLEDAMSRQWSDIRSFLDNLRLEQKQLVEAKQEASQIVAQEDSAERQFQMFQWDWAGLSAEERKQYRERVQQEPLAYRTPLGWTLERKNVRSIWMMWHFGDVRTRICPLKRINAKDLSEPTGIGQLSRTTVVMKKIEEKAKEMGIIPLNSPPSYIESIGPDNGGRIFDEVYPQFLLSIADNLGDSDLERKSQIESMKKAEINTIHKRLCKGTRKKAEQDGRPVRKKRRIVMASIVLRQDHHRHPSEENQLDELEPPSREEMEREEQRRVERQAVNNARGNIFFQNSANNRAISNEEIINNVTPMASSYFVSSSR